MKQQHRRAHGLIWLVLLPVLLLFVYGAQRGTPQPAPSLKEAPSPSRLGELP